MADTHKFSITLPVTTVQRLDARAALDGVTRTEVVAELIEQAFQRNLDSLIAAQALSELQRQMMAVTAELAAARSAAERLSTDMREGFAQIRDSVATKAGPQATDEESINSGALPPNLALLLVEIAARVTQPDKSKLEATRAAFRKAYLK